MPRALLTLALLSACHDGPTPAPSADDTAGDTDPTVEPEEGGYVHDPEVGPVTELPAGSEVTWPVDAGLQRTLGAILEQQVRPVLRFDHRRDATLFNAVYAVHAADVTRDAEGWSVDVDLGAVVITLTDHADSTREHVLLVAGVEPEDVVLVKSYVAGSDLGGPSDLRLDAVAAFDGRDHGAPALGMLDFAAGPPALDCDAQAWANVDGIPPIAVVMPPLSHCTPQECVKVREAWIRANHDVWRVRQMLEYMAAEDTDLRAWHWGQEGRTVGGLSSGEDTSLAWFFGEYAPYRFDAVRWTYNRLWEDYHDLDLEGLPLDLECRPASDADVCTTADPSAHHAVKSNIKLCDRFFDEKGDEERADLMVHEPLHHVFVPWMDNVPRLSPIMDTHTHGHGVACVSDVVTEKHYGIDDVRELATYRNSNGGDCWHMNYAFRNNDTYALAANAIGAAVRDGRTHTWPLEFLPPHMHDDGSYPVEACQGYVEPPPPGDDWFDPLNDCYKSGGEMVCPHGPGSGGGGLAPEFDLAVECPEL